MGPEDLWAIEDYIPTQGKEKGVEVWNLKGERGHSHSDGRTDVWLKKKSVRLRGDNGTQSVLWSPCPAKSPSSHLAHNF